ncbi:hypothetical protein SAMN06298216_0430 [Spirosomataceae bacterium TFI 002]|nr:hypothetical protein SAMN06298216_0430 [Spirosomataceae bacterium TFI 002]
MVIKAKTYIFSKIMRLDVLYQVEKLYFCDGKLPAPAESPRTGR